MITDGKNDREDEDKFQMTTVCLRLCLCRYWLAGRFQSQGKGSILTRDPGLLREHGLVSGVDLLALVLLLSQRGRQLGEVLLVRILDLQLGLVRRIQLILVGRLAQVGAL